jgi:hypothetical protein
MLTFLGSGIGRHDWLIRAGGADLATPLSEISRIPTLMRIFEPRKIV